MGHDGTVSVKTVVGQNDCAMIACSFVCGVHIAYIGLLIIQLNAWFISNDYVLLEFQQLSYFVHRKDSAPDRVL